MTEEKELFELGDCLGSGGFAHTYKAKVTLKELIDEYGVEEVAIKIPLDKQRQRVLKKELEMNVGLQLQLKEMEQRNICKYLGFEIYKGQFVMVMEYIEGGNLRNLIGEDGARKSIGVKKAVKITQGILNGLDVIHRRHFIHRDIKPENILMDGETPKIADLGLGSMLTPEKLGFSTKGVGTILYMAPEIIGEGSTYMYNADIWSVGVIFYEMLCCQLPFGMTDKTPYGHITNLIQDESVYLMFPEGLGIPKELQKIVTKTLTRNPVRRYKTPREISKDLKEISERGDEAVEREIGLIQQMLHNPTKTSQAELKLQGILKKHSDSPRVYLHFGEFYNRCGDYKKAIEMFKEGVEREPGNSLLRWDLAIAYQKNGSLKLAVENLRKALDLGLEASLQRYAKTLLNSLEKKI